MKSTIKELLLMLAAVLLFSIPAWADNPRKDSAHVHYDAGNLSAEDLAYMRALGLPEPTFLADSCDPAACRTFRDPDLYFIYAALAQRFVFSGDTCTPAVCRPFRDPDKYQIYAAIKGINLGGSAWALNGNTLTSEKFIGTISNHAFPIRTNNVERARFLPTGEALFGGGVAVTAAGEWLQIKTALGAWGWVHTTDVITGGSYIDGTGMWLGTYSNHSLKLFYNNSAATATIGNVGSLGFTGSGFMVNGGNNFLVANRMGVGTIGTIIHGGDALSTGYALKVRNSGGVDADNILVVQNDKKVGINTGTVSPTHALHVVGSPKFVDGFEGNAKLLQSDANGVGKWTAKDLPSAKDYGAVGDGVTNDSAALAQFFAAIKKKAGIIPAGTYLANGLIIDSSTVVYGYQATIKKNRSGTLCTLRDRAEIYGLKFHGNAPTYTGLGCVITTGNDQKLYDVEMLYNDSFNLAISKDVGIRFAWVNGQSIRYGSISNPSIKLGHGGASQETNGDRTFIGLFAGGTWLIDVSYSQTTIIKGCSFVNMKFHDNASKTLVSGNRIATLGSDITVKGTQCNVSDNIIAGGITIASGGQENVILGNVLAAGSVITDNSGNFTNEVKIHKLQIGYGTPNSEMDFSIVASGSNQALQLIQSASATGVAGISIQNNRATNGDAMPILNYGTTGGGNFGGTSVSSASSGVIRKDLNGTNSGGQLFIAGTPIIAAVGTTSTNIGFRLSAIGMRLDAISTVHTDATARLHIGAGDASTPGVILNSQASYTGTVNGSIWHNSTDNRLYSRLGGSNYQVGAVLTGSAALDFPSTAAQTSSDLTVTVTGAAAGDVVSIGPDNASVLANSAYTAWVSGINTVTIRFNNYSAAALDPLSGTFKVTVIKN